MTDIVATETAKAREQALILAGHTCSCVDEDEYAEYVVTVLLEAKADVLREYAPDAEPKWRSDNGRPGPYHILLRREVTARRLRGL